MSDVPKVSPPRTVADVESDIRAKARLRDLGRLRGEERPAGQMFDDLLEEHLVLTRAARQAALTKPEPTKEMPT